MSSIFEKSKKRAEYWSNWKRITQCNCSNINYKIISVWKRSALMVNPITTLLSTFPNLITKFFMGKSGLSHELVEIEVICGSCNKKMIISIECDGKGKYFRFGTYSTHFDHGLDNNYYFKSKNLSYYKVYKVFENSDCNYDVLNNNCKHYADRIYFALRNAD